MKNISIRDLRNIVKVFGRNIFDEIDGILYTNFTCGALEFSFTGKSLVCDFQGLPSVFGAPEGQDVPPPCVWVSVFLDGKEDEPYKRLPVAYPGSKVVILDFEQAETHTVKIVKLTENGISGLGFKGFITDGTISAPPVRNRNIIEFVGDSITCGYGNEATDKENGLDPAKENGWMTYAAITARELDLEPRFISMSGISVQNVPLKDFPGYYGMDDLYEYTDRMLEDRLAKKHGKPTGIYQAYDFTAQPAKYIVLNLGTNDSAQISFSENKDRAENNFIVNYRDFVKKIRRLNGSEAVIICAIGPMDHYLADHIRETVNVLNREGDQKIHFLKFHKMMTMGPDAGSDGHPSVFRQKLMAEELAAFMKTLNEEAAKC